MKFIKYLRCPCCDGRIIIPEQEFKRVPDSIEIPILNIPRCVNCGKTFSVKIDYDEFIKIELEEY